ncbi:MAG: hypothetical protein LC785_17490 [Acidobacteria bacterium]|nr:hypothetical protein [Acidobacteriota bacterium]MCA1643684.1 hypothetical protein [Acidobacteriota bacterium]
MRILTVVLLLLPAAVAPQDGDKWQRVYTFEDSIVEMNTSRVTFGGNGIGRVRFRTVFSKPEAVGELPGVKYKTLLETIELKCAARQYRIYETTFLDPKGEPIRSREGDITEKWKEVKFGSTMEKLSEPACRLIAEKRHDPRPPDEYPKRTLSRRPPP